MLSDLNEKNPIHGRVMATISKFSPQTFGTYYNSSGHKKQISKISNELYGSGKKTGKNKIPNIMSVSASK